MRTRLSIVTTAAGLLLGSLVLAGCGSDDDTSTGMASGHQMPMQRMRAGDVEMTVEPMQMNGGGARFEITMDTHSGSLDMDMEDSRLMVGGAEWPMERWQGDGPGGHHREGELSFRAGGPVDGAGMLTMPGFDEPMRMRWNMGPGAPSPDATE